MDPLCHTLVGAALAETRLGRTTRLAAPTLIIAANLPDIDVAAYVAGADAALGFRRGWTHGILAMVVLPCLLAAVVTALDRRRCRWRPDLQPVRGADMLFLSTVGLLSHPLLDWLNVYGVRLLMPFDDRWFYGDVLFIVDPWLWLALGAAVCLARAGRRPGGWAWATLAVVVAATVVGSSTPDTNRLVFAWIAALAIAAGLRWLVRSGLRPSRRQLVAECSLVLCGLYIGAMWLGRADALRAVPDLLGTGASTTRSMASPRPLTPRARDLVVATSSEILVADHAWGAEEPVVRRTIQRESPTELVERAWSDERVRGFRRWARFPCFETESLPEGTRVWMFDARYVRERTRGFGGAVVDVPTPRAPSATPP